jgi:acyl-CoA reductase-like NAD-dependent aldehyde dehydrogenase
MKILQSYKKKRDAKIRAKVHIHYRKKYEKQVEDMQLNHDIEIEQQQKFYNKAITKIRETEQKKWATVLSERDDIIRDLRNQIIDKRELFYEIKEREQELDAIKNLCGTKFKANVELIAQAYGSIESAFNHVDKYNRKHLKNDAKIIDAIKE